MDFGRRSNFECDYGYLLTTDTRGKIRPTHQTVKELLTSDVESTSEANEDVLRIFRVTPYQAQLELAESCLTILRFRDFSEEKCKNSLGALNEYILDDEGDDKKKMGKERQT
jgi:hypothetical protein